MWTRIRILLDPHSFGCLGSGSVLGMRIRIQELGNWPTFTNKPGFLPLKRLLYLHRCVFRPFTTLSKTSTFCDSKSLMICARIRIYIEIKSWIRIRIETSADPQHCFPPIGQKKRWSTGHFDQDRLQQDYISPRYRDKRRDAGSCWGGTRDECAAPGGCFCQGGTWSCSFR